MESVRVHCVTTTETGRRLADRLTGHGRLSVSTGRSPDTDADVLVVEHAPPERDAVALCESLVDGPPVVVFATDGDERLAGRAMRAGATDYWTPETAAEGPVGDWLHEHAERRRNRGADRTERERRLEALLAASDELHAADSVEQVCTTVVETAEEILDLPLTGVWMRADGDRALEPAAVSERGRELLDPPTFRPGESLAWAVHETGEPRWYDRVHEQEAVHNESTLIRSEMIVPIGERGVLLSGSRDSGAFDDADVRLLELLATSAEAALRRTERERELKRQNERLDRFAGVVGHDLRNPLAVATANLETARETGEDEPLDTAAWALDRVERLLEDLRRLASEGESVSGTQQVNLREVAEAAWSTADVGDARLDLGDDVTLSADPGRLRQLLENLLHNAVEHSSTSPASQARQDAVEHSSTSPQQATDAVEHSSTAERSDGPVSVTVGAFEGGFYVADDGPGIPPARRETVFDPGVTTAADGTGFGLAIVREIAEAHGWTVSVTESESGGARFEIRT